MLRKAVVSGKKISRCVLINRILLMTLLVNISLDNNNQRKKNQSIEQSGRTVMCCDCSMLRKVVVSGKSI